MREPTLPCAPSQALRRYKSAWLGLCVFLSLAGCAFLSVAGCAVDGANADCPPMPITDDPFDPKLASWREAAEEKGCVTPRGEALGDSESEP